MVGLRGPSKEKGYHPFPPVTSLKMINPMLRTSEKDLLRHPNARPLAKLDAPIETSL
jgi:hypothetical protein